MDWELISQQVLRHVREYLRPSSTNSRADGPTSSASIEYESSARCRNSVHPKSEFEAPSQACREAPSRDEVLPCDHQRTSTRLAAGSLDSNNLNSTSARGSWCNASEWPARISARNGCLSACLETDEGAFGSSSDRSHSRRINDVHIQDITRRVEAIEGHSFWQDSELGNLGLASNRLESQQDQLDSRLKTCDVQDTLAALERRCTYTENASYAAVSHGRIISMIRSVFEPYRGQVEKRLAYLEAEISAPKGAPTQADDRMPSMEQLRPLVHEVLETEKRLRQITTLTTNKRMERLTREYEANESGRRCTERQIDELGSKVEMLREQMVALGEDICSRFHKKLNDVCGRLKHILHEDMSAEVARERNVRHQQNREVAEELSTVCVTLATRDHLTRSMEDRVARLEAKEAPHTREERHLETRHFADSMGSKLRDLHAEVQAVQIASRRVIHYLRKQDLLNGEATATAGPALPVALTIPSSFSPVTSAVPVSTDLCRSPKSAPNHEMETTAPEKAKSSVSHTSAVDAEAPEILDIQATDLVTNACSASAASSSDPKIFDESNLNCPPLQNGLKRQIKSETRRTPVDVDVYVVSPRKLSASDVTPNVRPGSSREGTAAASSTDDHDSRTRGLKLGEGETSESLLDGKHDERVLRTSEEIQTHDTDCDGGASSVTTSTPLRSSAAASALAPKCVASTSDVQGGQEQGGRSASRARGVDALACLARCSLSSPSSSASGNDLEASVASETEMDRRTAHPPKTCGVITQDSAENLPKAKEVVMVPTVSSQNDTGCIGSASGTSISSVDGGETAGATQHSGRAEKERKRAPAAFAAAEIFSANASGVHNGDDYLNGDESSNRLVANRRKGIPQSSSSISRTGMVPTRVSTPNGSTGPAPVSFRQRSACKDFGVVTAQCEFCLRRYLRTAMTSHIQTCELRLVKCQYHCGAKVLVRNIEKHEKDCRRKDCRSPKRVGSDPGVTVSSNKTPLGYPIIPGASDREKDTVRNSPTDFTGNSTRTSSDRGRTVTCMRCHKKLPFCLVPSHGPQCVLGDEAGPNQGEATTLPESRSLISDSSATPPASVRGDAQADDRPLGVIQQWAKTPQDGHQNAAHEPRAGREPVFVQPPEQASTPRAYPSSAPGAMFPSARDSKVWSTASRTGGVLASAVSVPPSPPRSKDVRSWGSRHVTSWLRDSMRPPSAEVISRFRDKAIDGPALLRLTNRDLMHATDGLDITDAEARRQILEAIHALHG